MERKENQGCFAWLRRLKTAAFDKCARLRDRLRKKPLKNNRVEPLKRDKDGDEKEFLRNDLAEAAVTASLTNIVSGNDRVGLTHG
ncbi:hypothetical protein MAR_002304 [Mya arenaria]|uniref:Uncharacterized protein n=1 Tax=Mya arenaria TaxID=6604 RepID=A0ABY7FI89_MYAAR|nr:hypothetical protein MAR_002304 [Mya arenaria]